MVTEKNPILAAIKRGDAPEMLKDAASKGALPLPPEILFQIQILLTSDKNEKIRKNALKSLKERYNSEILMILEDKNVDPKIIDFCGRFYLSRKEILEKVVTHPKVPHRTLIEIAPKVNLSIAELIINNQIKLIEEPKIISALRKNPHLTPANLTRLSEIERDFLGGDKAEYKLKEESTEELEEELLDEVKEEVEEGAEDLEKSILNKLPIDVSKEELEELSKTSEINISKEEVEPEKLTVLQRLNKMTVSEKIKTALMGNREERGILVRDSNRLVAVTVLSSPKITESEIDAISQMRNVHQDVLRIIGTNREWLKKSKIVRNLVKNPKTPIAISLNLINRLTKQDLKFLVNDKSVPDALRRTAKRLIAKKGG